MKKILDYILVAFEGEDGKFSAKRLCGISSTFTGLILTAHVCYGPGDKIAEQTMLIAPLFVTGLAFFGITSWQTLKTQKQTNDVINNEV